MSGGEEARECGSGGLWTLRGGVKVGAGGRVKTVSLFQPQFTFTHTENHMRFQFREDINRKKPFLSGIARKRGGGIPMPGFFGPFFLPSNSP